MSALDACEALLGGGGIREGEKAAVKGWGGIVGTCGGVMVESRGEMVVEGRMDDSRSDLINERTGNRCCGDEGEGRGASFTLSIGAPPT